MKYITIKIGSIHWHDDFGLILVIGENDWTMDERYNVETAYGYSIVHIRIFDLLEYIGEL
jgi:hypothetical protein